VFLKHFARIKTIFEIALTNRHDSANICNYFVMFFLVITR